MTINKIYNDAADELINKVKINLVNCSDLSEDEKCKLEQFIHTPIGDKWIKFGLKLTLRSKDDSRLQKLSECF
jgi:hypothetical protein